MRKLIAITNIRNDGKRIIVGQPFEAEDEVADHLVSRNAAREATGADETSTDPTGQERADLIAAAIDELTDGDWTKAGAPKVKAVEQITGFDVSAEELAAFAKSETVGS